MEIRRATQDQIWPHRTEYHVLTYAEEGFAPLNIHTRDAGIKQEHLRAFAEAVNRQGQVGSLLPAVPLSAVPRHAVRGATDSTTLQRYLVEFFMENAASIHATKVLLDFRTPNVPRHVHEAIRLAAEDPSARNVRDLVVLE